MLTSVGLRVRCRPSKQRYAIFLKGLIITLINNNVWKYYVIINVNFSKTFILEYLRFPIIYTYSNKRRICFSLLRLNTNEYTKSTLSQHQPTSALPMLSTCSLICKIVSMAKLFYFHLTSTVLSSCIPVQCELECDMFKSVLYLKIHLLLPTAFRRQNVF